MVVVSVELVVLSVLLVVEPVELVVVELVSGGVVVVVVVVVVVRFGRVVVVGASVVGVRARLVRGVATGLTWLDGGSVTAARELRWRGAAVVVAGARTSASARCRGVVVKPITLPPIAPMSTAIIKEVQRRDSTKRIGLKTGSPPGRASLTR